MLKGLMFDFLCIDRRNCMQAQSGQGFQGRAGELPNVDVLFTIKI
jgi:hypothetical protein